MKFCTNPTYRYLANGRRLCVYANLVIVLSLSACASTDPPTVTHEEPSLDTLAPSGLNDTGLPTPPDTAQTAYDVIQPDIAEILPDIEDSTLLDARVDPLADGVRADTTELTRRDSTISPTDVNMPSETTSMEDMGGEDIPLDGDSMPPPSSWRSALYPEDWSPESTHESGAFLHDFSWAGYHNGELSLPTEFLGIVVDVATQGADTTGVNDSTSAIQSAIDEAATAGGGVVYFPPGLYRLHNHLTVTSSNIVLLGAGPEASRLYFTRDFAMTDASSISFVGSNQIVAEAPLVEDAASRGHVVLVDNASEFAVGDDAEIGWNITEAFVEQHGMTGTWQAFNGKYMTFFRRQVTAVDLSTTPNAITVDVPLRYDALVSDGATIRHTNGMLSEVGIADLGIANAVDWDAAWSFDRAHVVAMDYVSDGFVRNVHSFNPPSAPEMGSGSEDHLQSGGVIIRYSKRVTVKDCDMRESQHRGSGGNGYLFEIMQSSEILHDGCVAHAGRHNFIQNWGFGTTGCVWKDCFSTGGEAWWTKDIPFGLVGLSEYHHSLATANLVDGGVWDDGWSAVNRGSYSSGAGHSSTQCVFWRLGGGGSVESRQFGQGYVIGTGQDMSVYVGINTVSASGQGTGPEDWVEGEGEADTLEPASLYADQLSKRLSSP